LWEGRKLDRRKYRWIPKTYEESVKEESHKEKDDQKRS
jgi:hypothetical protein